MTREAKPVVLGDGDRILQIVTNLVTNALHATPADGEVTVDVALADGAGLVVVSDTGPGIPEAERESILRPFVTSDVRHGVGLGLPVASELAQAMGGTLVVGERDGRRGGVHARACRWRGRGRAEPDAPRALPPRAQPASELVAEQSCAGPPGCATSHAPRRHGRDWCFALPTWVTASCSLWTSAVAIGPPTLLSIAAATATSSAATASTMPTYSTVPCARSAFRIREVERRVMKTDIGRAPPFGPPGGRAVDGRAGTCPASRARAPIGRPR